MNKKFDNELKGVLFKNDDKETDKHPDYKGSATIEGVDYFMDAWINTADSGRKYMSFRFKQKGKPKAAEPTRRAAARHEPTGTGFYDMQDELPPF